MNILRFVAPVALAHLLACGASTPPLKPPPSVDAVDVKFALLGSAQTSGAYHGKRVHAYAVFWGQVPLIQDARFSKGYLSLTLSPSDMTGGKPECGMPIGQIASYVPTAIGGDVVSAKMGTVFEITGVFSKNDIGGSGGSLDIESLKSVGFCPPSGG